MKPFDHFERVFKFSSPRVDLNRPALLNDQNQFDLFLKKDHHKLRVFQDFKDISKKMNDHFLISKKCKPAVLLTKEEKRDLRY